MAHLDSSSNKQSALNGDQSEDMTAVREFKSSLVSKNITIQKRRTSVRLEPEMWSALKEISRREQCTIHDICSLISMRKSVATSLTAAIRVFLMLYFRAAASEEGHMRAGHGNIDYMKQRARMSAQPATTSRREPNYASESTQEKTYIMKG